jgi:dolichol-phosphate mannosyltransferase
MIEPPAAMNPTLAPQPHPAPLSPHRGLATNRILVSLATYNEAGNLAALIEEIHRVVPDAHILVIDDNSPDGTGKIADGLATRDPRVHVLHRPGKLGLGTATLAAMRYAMDHGYDFLQNMDADFSHPPRYLPGILAGMSKYDVMIGSRYTPGGGTENWPLARRIISRTVNSLVRFLFRMPVKDASGAYRCYRVSKLREAELERTQSRGYSFQQEVLFRCYKARCKLGEYPILFENRRAGASKVNRQEALRSIGMILYLGLKNFFGR